MRRRNDDRPSPEELLRGGFMDNEIEAANHRFEQDTRVALWEAINKYTMACGGDPARIVYGNARRQEAVALVESVLEAALAGQPRQGQT